MDDPVRAGAGWMARLWFWLEQRPPSQAIVSAAATAVAGLIVVEFLVLVVWAADTRSAASAATAFRVGADLWLLAHGAALDLPEGRVEILPFGLAAIPVLLGASAGYRLGVLHRYRTEMDSEGGAGRGDDTAEAESEGSPRQRWRREASGGMGAGRVRGAGSRPANVRLSPVALLRGVLTVVVPYVTVVCIIASVATDPTARPSLAGAALGTVFLVGSGAFAGLLRGWGSVGVLWQDLPSWVRVPAAAGSAGAVAAFGVAALGLASLLAAKLPETAALTAGLDTGVVGGIGLFLAQVALLPNLILWGLAYALGPGFATGAGGLVSVSQVRAGDLPDLPLFAMLPDVSLPGSARLVLAVVPVAAGCVLAVHALRGLPGRRFGSRAGHVAGASVVCGGLLAIAAYLSGGVAGGPGVGRFGPAAHWTGLFAAAEVGAVALGVTMAVELLGRRRRPDDPKRSAFRASSRSSLP